MNPELPLPKTCNEAAAQLFPQVSKVRDAFIEQVSDSISSLPSIQLLDLNDEYWALTLENAVFVLTEKQFRQYQPTTGLYAPVQESTLINQILANLNRCSQLSPHCLIYESFAILKNRTRLKSIIECARDLLSVDDAFFKPKSPYLVRCSNGFVNCVTRQFIEFSPDLPIKDKLPVKYVPDARCDLFIQMFLKHILSEPDIDLLQQFMSELMSGVNYAQKILILTGDAGWGKSTLMKILGSILGWERVGIIREQLYHDSLELGHYAGKHLLYCPDMNSQFLNHKESSIFKLLVGGDPVWADIRDNGRNIMEGNFPVVLACNARPQIKLDQDTEAWARRLIVLQFKKPEHEHHLGKLAEMLLQTEMSGILNWLLDGFAKLHKAGLQLTLTTEQQTKANVVLIASESASAFVRSCIVKKKDEVMGVAELYEKYQNWCRIHQLQPFTSKQFSQIAKTEIETGLGLKLRHDLVGENGKAVRGWMGLALIELGEDQLVKKQSAASDEQGSSGIC